MGISGDFRCRWGYLASYEYYLRENLNSLQFSTQSSEGGHVKSHSPRHSYITKADGSQRSLGIATIEDTVAQEALADVLNFIYKGDFIGFSYGFRLRRNAQKAPNSLAVAMECKYVNWVLDADISDFLDATNQEWQMKFLTHRIVDKRILYLIARWLEACIIEDGLLHSIEEGTPQCAYHNSLCTPYSPFIKKRRIEGRDWVRCHYSPMG